jgi:hypothetical protein
MAINSNSSQTAVVRESKLYTGLKNMKVVGINPTKEEMEAMGYRPKNAPVYLSTEGSLEKLRLDFFLQGEGLNAGEIVRTKIAFFLENIPRVDKNGTKGEWINNVGRTAWGDISVAPTQFAWFDAATARKCKVGEADVHLFLINWLNVKPGDEAKLDNFDALFSGNYSELRALLAANLNNEIKVLLTVKDGKYQSVYTKYFDRATNKRTSYWEGHIKKQSETGYPIKEDFSNSFEFQEWSEPVGLISGGGDVDDDNSSGESDPF